MTTQQENYINSKLEKYLGYLESEDERWIEGEVLKELEKKEEKERERLDGMLAEGRIALSGREYEAHMKKFSKNAQKELYDHFKAVYDAENKKSLERYRRELEKEVMVTRPRRNIHLKRKDSTQFLIFLVFSDFSDCTDCGTVLFPASRPV